MKKIVVVSSSLRVNSTSRALTNMVVEGLKINNDVEIIDLRNLNFNFCKGCLACQNNGKCVINDDVKSVLGLVNDADILVFATPIYYYSVSGQLKTFLDRLNPLYISKNRKFKEAYAIFTCADDNISAIAKPKEAIEGFVSCFEGVKFIDSFNGLGLNTTSDITDDLLNKAYQFGKNIK